MFSAQKISKSSNPSSNRKQGRNSFIQPKLNIGKPGDKYEIEADRAADQIIAKDKNTSSPFFPAAPSIQKNAEEEIQKQESQELEIQEKPLAETLTPVVQLKESDEENTQKKEEESVQQKDENNIGKEITPIQQQLDQEIQEKEDEEVQEKEEELQTLQMSGGNDDSSLESNLNNTKGGGSPLDKSTKSEMESGFGADFSNVNIHTDNNAVQMNQQLGSQAFTNGNDIYFNEGKYNPKSNSGKHLLAHELTHTVQQGASAPKNSIQKTEEETSTISNPLIPSTPLDISQGLVLNNEWVTYLDHAYNEGERTFDLNVKIGENYRGTIKVRKRRSTAEGETAKYELARGNNRYLEVNGWNFLNPLRQAGVTPILVLREFGEEQQTTGFLSVKTGDLVHVSDINGFISGVNENLESLGFLGIDPINVVRIENTFENGRLVFQVNELATVVDGFLEAGGGLGISGETFTFNLNANVNIAGLAEGEFNIARGEDGNLSGQGQIQADIANVQATISVEYEEGVVTIQGTGRMNSEKFTGEITLLVTDATRSTQLMQAALGVESMDTASEQTGNSETTTPKSMNNQVLAGWGEVQASITPWLEGTAKIGIDHLGHVTIVGEIVVPNEIELMEQRGRKVDLFDVEIRGGYGIPLVGQVFLFASVGMFVNAGFGPLVLRNVGFTGTYSTDPSVLQRFSITGTLGINAFAVVGLEAEAGVGVTLIGHDIKAGVNVTAAAGLRAYAEATPTFEYIESQNEQGGKVGESHLRGHFEAAAQLFLQLSGALFYELDSPWWSPAPDGREEFPLGEVQYPIGDSLGIGADINWLVGSPEVPELTFSPVEFDPDKFTADVMADPPPRLLGNSEESPEGQWSEQPGSEQNTNPEITGNGQGLPPNNRQQENLRNLPDEQKYMRALDEMSRLENANPRPTISVVEAEARKVKRKYGISKIETRNEQDDQVSIYVEHVRENNGRHLLNIPLMSTAERARLLNSAMEALQTTSRNAADQEGKITRVDAEGVLTTLQRNHPVISDARIVDGQNTWDYFIDIGDREETVRGNLKKETDQEPPSEEIQQHERIARQIESALRQESNTLQGSSFQIFYNRLREKAVQLKNEFQPQLNNGINLNVSFLNFNQDREDNDVDIHISIAPNDTILDVELQATVDKFTQLQQEAANGEGFTFSEIIQKINEIRSSTTVTINRTVLQQTQNNNWEFTLHNPESGANAGPIEIARNGRRINTPEETLERLINRLKNDFEGNTSKLETISTIEVKLAQMMNKAGISKPSTTIQEVGNLLTEIQQSLLELIETVTGYPDPTYRISGSKASEVEVENLSPNRVMGQRPSGIPLGWRHLQEKALTRGGGNFVRMHLINMKFGGPGTTANLVPGAEKYNSQTEYNFDSKIKRKIGPQPINSTNIDPQYNNVVWIKVKVNYFSGSQFPSNNPAPTINGITAEPNWFAQSIEFTSGDYTQNGSTWTKNSAITERDTLQMDLPQWDAATNLSLRYATRGQLKQVAMDNDFPTSSITPLNMRILRGLTFNSFSELHGVVMNYIRVNNLVNEAQVQQLINFKNILVSLVSRNKLKI